MVFDEMIIIIQQQSHLAIVSIVNPKMHEPTLALESWCVVSVRCHGDVDAFGRADRLGTLERRGLDYIIMHLIVFG